MNATNSVYNGDSIEVLEGLEHVRMRPGMYIGSTNTRGLHHLVWEIVDNAIDEYLAGYCTRINVAINEEGSVTVEDNGRGVPVDLNTKKGISASRIVYTQLNAGGKFNGKAYKVSGGLHGVGASVVNALSSWMEIEIYQNGKIYRDYFEDGGKPKVKLIKGLLPAIEGKTTRKTGTKVTFMPDAGIFETTEFKADSIKKRLKESAYLNKGLLIHFEDKRTGEKVDFKEDEGIRAFIQELNKDKERVHDEVIYLSGQSQDIEAEIAFQYTKEFNETILSYCNNISTVEGGTHVSGLKTALTRVMNQYAKELGLLKEKDENFDGKDIRNGMVAVLSIRHPKPQYEGQTKTKLGNTDAKGAVDEVFSQEAEKYFDRNVNVLKSILDNAQRAYKLRKTEEKAKENFLNKSATLTVNGKLAACQSKNPQETEIFIVEGDSAGGSAKQGRNRKFQAILPLRGKVLNVEKAALSKIIGNLEIASLISALGCGFGEGLGDDFNFSKLKYAKIIILTDADVDGSHIRTLLLTFFHRYMPELIFEGSVYIGMPPLFKVTQNKKIQYFYNDRELANFKAKNHGKSFEIQRYKGLGEMNPSQLWETTLNPETRYIKQVTIEDAMEADEITNILMGSNVVPRKEFIYTEAHHAELDL